MTLARSERVQLCTLLDARGPAAPTLCEGWDAAHIAAHLWVRETDPLAVPGIVLGPLEPLTERRMERALDRFGFDELVRRLRRGPGAPSVFSLPGLDAAANGVEYFVHHEDLRRARPDGALPRVLPPTHEDELWGRLALVGRAMFRKVGVPVVARRTDAPGHRVVLKPGRPGVVVSGLPSEVMLFAAGRGDVADVEVGGDPALVEQLRATNLGI